MSTQIPHAALVDHTLGLWALEFSASLPRRAAKAWSPPQGRPSHQRVSQAYSRQRGGSFSKCGEQGLAGRSGSSGSSAPRWDSAGDGTRRELGGSMLPWACHHKSHCARRDAGSRAPLCKIEGAPFCWAEPAWYCSLGSLPGSGRDSPRCAMVQGESPAIHPHSTEVPPVPIPGGFSGLVPPQGRLLALLVLGHEVSMERSPEFLLQSRGQFWGVPWCPRLTWRPESPLFVPVDLRCPRRATRLLFYSPWFRLRSWLLPASALCWSSFLPGGCSVQRSRGHPRLLG